MVSHITLHVSLQGSIHAVEFVQGSPVTKYVNTSAEVTNNLVKFCQWWRKQCHTADIESLTISGLPTGVAGQKGGVYS